MSQDIDSYLHQHFLPMSEFARRSAMAPTALQALIAGRVIPGAIYSTWPNGAFTSVGEEPTGTPKGSPTHWYSPAALWWVRRATVLRRSADEIAHQFREEFVAEFIAKLPEEPFARLGYPEVYRDGAIEPQLLEAKAHAEWDDWITGGYAICLRNWSVSDVFAKVILRGRVLDITDEGRKHDLPQQRMLELIDVLAALETVMLPFAPHQRPTGTPGLWIDAILRRYRLGQPLWETSAERAADDRICA